jgi:hypothetical protein
MRTGSSAMVFRTSPERQCVRLAERFNVCGTEPWTPSILDFNMDDYRNPAGLPVGIINFANSPNLTSRE